MERNFSQELADLIAGKIEKIEINTDEFTSFRQEWLKIKEKDWVVGEAHFGGDVTYRYEPGHNENE